MRKPLKAVKPLPQATRVNLQRLMRRALATGRAFSFLWVREETPGSGLREAASRPMLRTVDEPSVTALDKDFGFGRADRDGWSLRDAGVGVQPE